MSVLKDMLKFRVGDVMGERESLHFNIYFNKENFYFVLFLEVFVLLSNNKQNQNFFLVPSIFNLNNGFDVYWSTSRSERGAKIRKY